MPRSALTGDELVASQIEKSKKPTDTFKEYAEWLGGHGVKISAANAQAVSRLYGVFQAENRDAGTGRSRGTTKPVTKPKVNEQPADLDEVDEAEVATPAKKPAAKRRGASADNVTPPAKKPAAAPRSGRRGKPAADVEAPY